MILINPTINYLSLITYSDIFIFPQLQNHDFCLEISIFTVFKTLLSINSIIQSFKDTHFLNFTFIGQ